MQKLKINYQTLTDIINVKFKIFDPIKKFHTKQKYLSFMFKDATSFNQAVNDWSVGNRLLVPNVESMFYGASKFNQPLSSWNLTNTTGGNTFVDTNMSLANLVTLTGASGIPL